MKTLQKLRHYLLTAITASVLMACQPQEQTAAAVKASQPPAPQVSVAQVINERITEWDEFTGRLEAPQTVALRPRVSGYIEQVIFTEGALVTEGDALFIIDAKPFQAQVNRLQADVIDAQSQVQLAQSELARGQQLKNKNALAQEELDNRVSRHQQANALVNSRKSVLALALLDLDYTQVRAPISGRISQALITKGNYVSAGQSQLTTLVSTDKIFAYFDASEQLYLKYNRLAREGRRPSSRENNTPVLMGLIDDEDYPYVGHIDFMDNQVNKETGTIRGRAVFDNIDGRFTPGLFARIKMAGSASYDGILIDDKAVGTDLGNKFVFILDENQQVQYRKVELGQTHHGLRLIKSGLEAGDTIVVNGLQRIRSGAQVNASTINMASELVLADLKIQQQRVDALQNKDAIAASSLLLDDRG